MPSPRLARLALAAALALTGSTAAGAEPPSWRGIEAAPAGAVMIWSAERILRSDDGDTFTAAPVGAGVIDQVVVGRDGSYAVLLRGDPDPTVDRAILELHPRGGEVRRIELLGPRSIDAGDGEIALLYGDHLERRAWDGRILATHAVPPPCLECDGAFGQGDLDLAADGTIRVTDTEINTCHSTDSLEWQRLVRVSRGQGPASAREVTLSPEDYAATWRIGAHGWLYGISYARRLVAVGRGGAQPVGVAAVDSWPELLVAHNERATLAAIGHDVWRLDGARARLLARAPAAPRSLAVDARTRPWIVIEADDGDRVLRYERRRSWVPVRLPDP